MTVKKESDVIAPKMKIEDVWDLYTLCVLIFNISEDVFWDCEYAVLMKIVGNIAAYRSWQSSPKTRGGQQEL